MNLSKIYWHLLLISWATFCIQDNFREHLLSEQSALMQSEPEKQKDAATFFIQTGVGLIVFSCIKSLYSPHTDTQFNYCIISLGTALISGSYLCYKQIQTRQPLFLQRKNWATIKKEYASIFGPTSDIPYLPLSKQKCH